MKTNKFIEESIKVHGDKYDYKNTKYLNAKTKVKIFCKKHGEFEQLPGNHKRGNGCPKCIYNKLTKKEILEQFKNIHGDKYNYSSVVYKGDNIKVKIICQEHGIFKQTPGIHKTGSGCKTCAGLDKLNNTTVVEQFKKIHGGKYKYSLVNYKNNSTKIKIICLEHGIFEQTPNNHKSGNGCKKCSGLERLDNKIIIEHFKKIHKNKYDYSLVEYIGAHTKVKIICKKHGEWEQTPNNHKNGNGCPVCKESKGEREVRNWLNNNKINFISQYKFKNCKNSLQLPFDFYLPEYNLCIEYNGMQHYKPIEHFGGDKEFKKRKINDKIKKEYCQKNNILLITINYNENVEKKLTRKW